MRFAMYNLITITPLQQPTYLTVLDLIYFIINVSTAAALLLVD